MRKIRWMWSYKIGETEKWLDEQAKAGYRLQHVNTWTRAFTFEQTEPSDMQYHIDYKNPKQEIRLAEAGWETVQKKGKWTIRKMQQPKMYPSRQDLFKRLQRHTILLSTLLGLVFTYISIMTIFSMLLFSSPTESGISLATQVVMIALFIAPAFFSIYLMKYYKRQEMKLLNIEQHHQAPTFKKFRLGWSYDVFGTKKWLEKMADEGYEAVKVSIFSFHFKEKSTEHIDYEFLYMKKADAHYYQFNQEMGWQHLFSTNSARWNTSIWSKPRQEGEEKDELMDVHERKKMMKRQVGFMTVFPLMLVFMNGFVFLINYPIIFDEQAEFSLLSIILCLNLAVAIAMIFVVLKMWKNYWGAMKDLNAQMVY